MASRSCRAVVRPRLFAGSSPESDITEDIIVSCSRTLLELAEGCCSHKLSSPVTHSACSLAFGNLNNTVRPVASQHIQRTILSRDVRFAPVCEYQASEMERQIDSNRLTVPWTDKHSSSEHAVLIWRFPFASRRTDRREYSLPSEETSRRCDRTMR